MIVNPNVIDVIDILYRDKIEIEDIMIIDIVI